MQDFGKVYPSNRLLVSRLRQRSQEYLLLMFDWSNTNQMFDWSNNNQMFDRSNTNQMFNRSNTKQRINLGIKFYKELRLEKHLQFTVQLCE